MGAEIVRATTSIEVRNLDDVERLARIAVASNLVRVKRAEEAAVILLTGRELGLSPMQSLRGIYVVNGQPVLSADLLVAVVRASGLCASWRTIESTADLCTIETLRRGEEHPARRTWTMADAKRAGLTGKGTWAQYPAAMLRHRCAADLAREVYPDVCLGLYTPDELGGDEPRPAAPPARSLPPLEALGIEAAPAMPEIDLGAPQPLTEREVSGLLAEIASASSEAELREVWEVARPSVDLSSDSTRRTIARAINARRRELTPPPDGTSGPQGPGTSTSAEGSTTEGAAPVAMDARAYLEGCTVRAHLEATVRKHGKAQGRAWLTLAAQRLVAIDQPEEHGLRLSLVGATQTVERWAHEGPRRKRAA